MVQETFGDTDLIFPPSPTIGDVFEADNGYPYEFMSDGRWRNVIQYNLLGEVAWVPDTDINGDSILLNVPIASGITTSSVYPLIYEDGVIAPNTLIAGVQAISMPAYTAPLLGQVYVNHTQPGAGSAWYGDETWAGLPLTGLLLPEHVPAVSGQMIWLAGFGLSAISNSHRAYMVIDLSEHVSDLNFIEDVSWRFTYDHGIALGSAADVNSWVARSYDELDANNHYWGTSLIALDSLAGSATWGDTNISSDFVQRGMTEFRPFDAGAKYLWLECYHMANNVLRDFRIEFRDNRAPGDPATRKLSGMTMSADGNKIYTSDEYTPGSMSEFDMTAFDLETAAYLQSQNSFDDPLFPAAEVLDPLGLWVRSDGNQIYVCDSKGKIKQYRYRVPFDITSVDDVVESNQWYWSDYYKEFTTVASPIDIHISEQGDKAFVLEADDVIREYDLGTDWDVSTAVDSGNSLDCSSKTADPKNFTISRDGKVLVLAYAGNLSQSILPTANTLVGTSWNGVDSLISIDDPKGVVFNNLHTKLFVADKPTDLAEFMRVGVFEKSG